MSGLNMSNANTRTQPHTNTGGIQAQLDPQGIDAVRGKQVADREYNPLKGYGADSYTIDNTQPGSNDSAAQAQNVSVDAASAYTGGPSVADSVNVDVSLQSIFSSLIQIRDALRNARSNKGTFDKQQLQDCKTMLQNVQKNTLSSLTQVGGTQRQPAGAVELTTVAKQVEYLLNNDFNTPVSYDDKNVYQQKKGVETDDQFHARVADIGETNATDNDATNSSVYGLEPKKGEQEYMQGSKQLR